MRGAPGPPPSCRGSVAANGRQFAEAVDGGQPAASVAPGPTVRCTQPASGGPGGDSPRLDCGPTRGAGGGPEWSLRHDGRPPGCRHCGSADSCHAPMTNATTMTTCTTPTCRREYAPTDEDLVRYHTEPYGRGGSCHRQAGSAGTACRGTGRPGRASAARCLACHRSGRQSVAAARRRRRRPKPAAPAASTAAPSAGSCQDGGGDCSVSASRLVLRAGPGAASRPRIRPRTPYRRTDRTLRRARCGRSRTRGACPRTGRSPASGRRPAGGSVCRRDPWWPRC